MSNGTFSEFLASRVGPKWVVAARVTDRLRHRYGDEVKVITPKRYKALEAEYECLTGLDPMGYQGEPSKQRRMAANDLIAVLQHFIAWSEKETPDGKVDWARLDVLLFAARGALKKAGVS